MSQTLTVLPALTVPIALTEGNTLWANVAAIQNLDNRMTLALRVLAKIYQLDAYAGIDYKLDFPALERDALNLFGAANIASAPWGAGPVGKWEAVIDWSAGRTADATLSADVETLVNEMGFLRNVPETTLYLIILYLDYQLSLLAAP